MIGGTSESNEQQLLFTWAGTYANIYPELSLLYHIPNGGKRSKTTGGRLKAEGLRPGVPDICLPVPRPPYSGMYIEMKSKTGRVSVEQKEWLEQLRQYGNYTAICRSFEDAATEIMNYIGMKGSIYHVQRPQ